MVKQREREEEHVDSLLKTIQSLRSTVSAQQEKLKAQNDELLYLYRTYNTLRYADFFTGEVAKLRRHFNDLKEKEEKEPSPATHSKRKRRLESADNPESTSTPVAGQLAQSSKMVRRLNSKETSDAANTFEREYVTQSSKSIPRFKPKKNSESEITSEAGPVTRSKKSKSRVNMSSSTDTNETGPVTRSMTSKIRLNVNSTSNAMDTSQMDPITQSSIPAENMALSDPWKTETDLPPARSNKKNRAGLLLEQLKSDRRTGSRVIDQCIELWLGEINMSLSHESKLQLKSSMHKWIELTHTRNTYAHNDLASETSSFDTLEKVHKLLTELPFSPGLDKEEKKAIETAIFLWRSRRYRCVDGRWTPNPVAAPAEVLTERAEKREAKKEKKSWKKDLKERLRLEEDVSDRESFEEGYFCQRREVDYQRDHGRLDGRFMGIEV